MPLSRPSNKNFQVELSNFTNEVENQKRKHFPPPKPTQLQLP